MVNNPRAMSSSRMPLKIYCKLIRARKNWLGAIRGLAERQQVS